MKTLITSLFLLPLLASASDGMEEKIKSACLNKVQGNKHITKPEETCACIAKTHVEEAYKKPILATAEKQLEWVLAVYTERDPKKAQKLVDKEPKLAPYDNMVAEDCMDPEGGYASPIE